MHFIQCKQFSETNATSHTFQQISGLNIFPECFWPMKMVWQATCSPPACSWTTLLGECHVVANVVNIFEMAAIRKVNYYKVPCKHSKYATSLWALQSSFSTQILPLAHSPCANGCPYFQQQETDVALEFLQLNLHMNI